VPTEEAFAPDGGGYETVLTSYSNLDIHAASQIVAASLELTRELTPGMGPETSPVEPPTHPWAEGIPWDYGILGPELE